MFAKVNRIVFTQQGNKFGLCDGDGNTALWQVGVAGVRPRQIFIPILQASSTSAPFFSIQTHTRNTADFVFQVLKRINILEFPQNFYTISIYFYLFQGGSSSLLATAGYSTDGRNVALWDTLLPSRRACVQAFKYGASY